MTTTETAKSTIQPIMWTLLKSPQNSKLQSVGFIAKFWKKSFIWRIFVKNILDRKGAIVVIHVTTFDYILFNELILWVNYLSSPKHVSYTFTYNEIRIIPNTLTIESTAYLSCKDKNNVLSKPIFMRITHCTVKV